MDYFFSGSDLIAKYEKIDKMLKKNRLFILLFFIVLFVLLFHILFFKGRGNITIHYTTDLQGFITPHIYTWPDKKGNPMMGGSAYLATHIEKERAFAKRRNRSFLLLDAGDIFLGTPEGHFSKGRTIIEIMNAIGYDAMVVGDRDYAFGEENLRNLANLACFPLLGADIINEDTGEHPDYIKPYLIKDYNGFKVGIIGAVTPLTGQHNLPEHIKGLTFISPIQAVKKYASLLEKKGVNLIIVLSQLGLDMDKELVREIPAIDFIIGGHDKSGWRDLYVDPVRGTIIGETWEKGCWTPRCDLTVDLRKNKIVKYRIKNIDIFPARLKPDKGIQAIIQKYLDQKDEKMREVIGYTREALYRDSDEESSLGGWIADILREKLNVDIALVTGLQADLKQGEITVGDIYNILPIINGLEIMGFNLAIVELSGEKIKNIFEHSVGWALENSKYGILQVSGLKMKYDPKQKGGRRIVDITINGEKLDMNKTYKVAVNGYLASGGDSYYDIITAEKRYDTGLMDFDVLVEYIKAHSPITAPPLEGRIVRVETEK